MGAQPLPSKPQLDDGPRQEVTRDVWDLDDDQLWEVLEALQMKTARREGVASPYRLPQGSLRVPGGNEANVDDREVGLRREGMGPSKPIRNPQVSLGPMQMSATSSACLQLG